MMNVRRFVLPNMTITVIYNRYFSATEAQAEVYQKST